uniref:Uncharacterized protein n=1 Tax=Tetranychus urticae TaxID=32264 RepID=T1KE68_TETUR
MRISSNQMLNVNGKSCPDADRLMPDKNESMFQCKCISRGDFKGILKNISSKPGFGFWVEAFVFM